MWVDVNVHLELMLVPSESVNQAAAAMAVKFIATGTNPISGTGLSIEHLI